MKKLSLITINQNNAEGLRRTIESVVFQTYIDYEYIVIDGASTDESVNILKQYDNRITFWISEPDTGIYNAMNKGILKATGEYCLFLNSGDRLSNDRVLEEVFLHEITEDIVCGNAVFEKSHLHKERLIIPPEKLKASDLILNFIPHQATFIKRSLFSEIHLYDEHYKISSDWAFFIETLLVYNKKYKHLNVLVSQCESTGISNQNENIEIMDHEHLIIVSNLIPAYFEDLFDLQRKTQQLNSFDSVYFEKFRHSFVFRLYKAMYRRLIKYGVFEIKKRIKYFLFKQKTKKADRQRKKQIELKINELPTDLFTLNKSDKRIIVSLTSYGHRVEDSVSYAIYSIFSQTRVPDKVVLFLDEKKWNNNNLPGVLKKLQKVGLFIEYCDDIGPHTKFIPALKMFPEDILITVDDDVYYEKDVIKELIDAYTVSNKKTIICHKAVIPERSIGKFTPYSTWKDASTFANPYSKLSPLGVGGVLYPPHIFSNEIFNVDVFLKICPIADDLWFWVMELNSDIQIKVLFNSCFKFDYINNLEQLNPGSGALHFKNCSQGRNDIQLNELLKYYKHN